MAHSSPADFSHSKLQIFHEETLLMFFKLEVGPVIH